MNGSTSVVALDAVWLSVIQAFPGLKNKNSLVLERWLCTLSHYEIKISSKMRKVGGRYYVSDLLIPFPQ